MLVFRMDGNDKVGGEWVDDVEDWHRLQAF